MDILIITQYFWPENFKINDLSQSLSEKGHQVTVLTGIPNYPEGEYYQGYSFFGSNNNKQEYKGVKIIRSKLIKRGNGSNFRLILNYFSFAFFSSFTSLFKLKNNFDVIFVFEVSPLTVAIPAILYKKKTKAPICMWVLDLWPENILAGGRVSSKFIFNVTLNFVKFVYRNCDKILIASKGFCNSIMEKGVNKEKMIYFPNWAEDLFKPVKLASEELRSKIPVDGFIVMFAGNIGESQDFQTILDAAEILKKEKNIYFIIIGDGRRRDYVYEQIKSKELSDTFHLIGKYSIENMPDFYFFADVMLVTLKKNEAFSLTIPAKIQSYLACGKPIVATLDGEGAKIITESGAGFCSNSGDSEGLAKNIIKLKNMKKQDLIELGNNALEYSKRHFDRNTLMNEVEGILKNMVKI